MGIYHYFSSETGLLNWNFIVQKILDDEVDETKFLLSIDSLLIMEYEGESGGDNSRDESVIVKPKTSPKKKKKSKVTICTANCRYEVLRRVSRKLGFKEVGEDDDWMLFWTDCSVSLDRVMSMKRFQKINHFPGMSEICRKDMLARNMNRLAKSFPKEYNIFPKSWVLPADYGDFQNFYRTKKGKCYIVKPDTGCQGKGIFVTKNPAKDIKPTENVVVQQYISKPLLMDNFKFDLRIYVLVTSCDPLRIYVFNEGLVRLATVDYVDPSVSNTDDVCMHLTNYAINKHSENFVRPTVEDINSEAPEGSKRTLAALRHWLDENKHDKEKIFSDMHDLIIKTIITAHPILQHNYRTCFPHPWKGSACFEILGFDIILDRKLKPWLLEVNHSPSFHTDSKLDKEVKTALIHNTLELLDLRMVDRKKCLEEDRKRVQQRLTGAKTESREEKIQNMRKATDEWLKHVETHEKKKTGGFKRIYPPDSEKVAETYVKFFKSSTSLFQTTVAQRAREEAARTQLEEIRIKNEIESAKRQGKPIPDLQLRNRGESKVDSKNSSIQSSRQPTSSGKRSSRLTTPKKKKREVDINRPMAITDAEENERKFQMRQRAAQVKSMGIAEWVNRLVSYSMANKDDKMQGAQAQNVQGIQKEQFDPGIKYDKTTTTLSLPSITSRQLLPVQLVPAKKVQLQPRSPTKIQQTRSNFMVLQGQSYRITKSQSAVPKPPLVIRTLSSPMPTFFNKNLDLNEKLKTFNRGPPSAARPSTSYYVH